MFGWFKKKGEAKPVVRDWEEYKGFRICATPIPESSQYRISGIIEKDGANEGDEVQSQTFIRADLIPSLDEAKVFSIRKAKLMVDQLGKSLFD